MMLNIKPIKQKKRMCGPASLSIVLKYYGINKNQEELKKILSSTYLTGTKNKKIIKVSKDFNLKAKYKTNSSINEIRKLLSKKIPPIIGWFSPEGASHYSVIKGLDKSNIFIVDPELNKTRKIKIKEFEKNWFDINWENLNFFKKIIISSKIFFYNKFNKSKKQQIHFPIKKSNLVHKEIIIIQK